MNLLMAIGTWFGQNILTKPEFFVGLLVFVGYLFLGKKIYEAVGGFIKATVGLKTKFELNAAVIDPYFGLQAVDEAIKNIIEQDSSKSNLAAAVMMALLIGFVINILLVLFRKFTKVRTLFITGHIMQQQASTAAWMIFFLFPQFQNITGVALIGIFAGIYWAVGSNLSV